MPFMKDIDLFRGRVDGARRCFQSVSEALDDDYLWHTYASSWDHPCDPDDDTRAQVASCIVSHALDRE